MLKPNFQCSVTMRAVGIFKRWWGCEETKAFPVTLNSTLVHCCNGSQPTEFAPVTCASLLPFCFPLLWSTRPNAEADQTPAACQPAEQIFVNTSHSRVFCHSSRKWTKATAFLNQASGNGSVPPCHVSNGNGRNYTFLWMCRTQWSVFAWGLFIQKA